MTHLPAIPSRQHDLFADPPRIYVICQSAHHDGIQHGAWIDLTQSQDAILTAIQAMLSASPAHDAESWAIDGYEGLDETELSHWKAFADFYDYARFIEKYGALGEELLMHCDNVDTARMMMEQTYAGCYVSLSEFGEQELVRHPVYGSVNLTCGSEVTEMVQSMEQDGEIFIIETAPDAFHIFWTGR